MPLVSIISPSFPSLINGWMSNLENGNDWELTLQVASGNLCLVADLDSGPRQDFSQSTATFRLEGKYVCPTAVSITPVDFHRISPWRIHHQVTRIQQLPHSPRLTCRAMRRAGGVACRWGRRPIEFTVGQRLASGSGDFGSFVNLATA